MRMDSLPMGGQATRFEKHHMVDEHLARMHIHVSGKYSTHWVVCEYVYIARTQCPRYHIRVYHTRQGVYTLCWKLFEGPMCLNQFRLELRNPLPSHLITESHIRTSEVCRVDIIHIIKIRQDCPSDGLYRSSLSWFL